MSSSSSANKALFAENCYAVIITNIFTAEVNGVKFEVEITKRRNV